ncbi:MAG TPA: hemerythrin family protein [Anaeromyxobacter sp.]|nr:hemerythrin family protein [Anaeromyxobacter sp.]
MSFELDQALLTGDPQIDAQHRELFSRVDRLLHASRERRREEVARLIDYLGDYVVSHFAAEERIMEASRYPGLEAHRLEHRRFLEELGALRREFLADGPGPLFVIRIGNRVTAWLREHVYRVDRSLVEWLRAQHR